jgi:hypothetical protein
VRSAGDFGGIPDQTRPFSSFPAGVCIVSQLADAVLFGLGYIGCSGTVRVPMLKVIRSFDGPEILLIAAASVLVASITFLL